MRTVFTIGHSTREIAEFVELLRMHEITQLVDIRTIPKSRHNPQYGQTELEKSLGEHGIKYVYLKNLGGLRPAVVHSVNTEWRNKSFRNYADYMQTDLFKEALDELVAFSVEATTAIMCAEAVPWRCHRSLVADGLVVRDVPVCEIISATSIREHTLTAFAVVHGTEVTYPSSDSPAEDEESSS